jgi:hypothetical protein
MSNKESRRIRETGMKDRHSESLEPGDPGATKTKGEKKRKKKQKGT